MPLDDVETKLCRLIERRSSALLDDLRFHVELPTGGGNTPALDETRARLCERLGRLGAQTTLIPGDPKPAWLLGPDFEGRGDVSGPPTAVCTRAGSPSETPKVLIAGHLDTVHPPGGPFRRLTIAPDGRTATGPGCVDMKGGLVIALAALEALEEAGLAGNWSFLMNSDEETGSYHSFAAIDAEARRHDWGIALEPALAGGELAIERGGSGQFMIEARGRAAHVGRNFAQGISAVVALARAIVASAEFSDPDRGLAVNIGPLRGGDTTNAVPHLARGWGNVRFRDPAGADELAGKLDALASSADSLPGILVERSFNRPAKPLSPATERLALACRGASEDLGRPLPFASTGGVCDGNIMQGAGLPTVDTLGVRGGGLHTPEEWIELPSLVERCQMLVVVLHRIWRGEVGSETRT